MKKLKIGDIEKHYQDMIDDINATAGEGEQLLIVECVLYNLIDWCTLNYDNEEKEKNIEKLEKAHNLLVDVINSGEDF